MQLRSQRGITLPHLEDIPSVRSIETVVLSWVTTLSMRAYCNITKRRARGIRPCSAFVFPTSHQYGRYRGDSPAGALRGSKGISSKRLKSRVECHHQPKKQSIPHRIREQYVFDIRKDHCSVFFIQHLHQTGVEQLQGEKSSTLVPQYPSQGTLQHL